eukprot:474794_1
MAASSSETTETIIGFIAAKKYGEILETNPEQFESNQERLSQTSTDTVDNDDYKEEKFKKPSEKLKEFNEYFTSIDLEQDQSDKYFKKTPKNKKIRRLSNSGLANKIRAKTSNKLKKYEQFLEDIDYSKDGLEEYELSNIEINENDIIINDENKNDLNELNNKPDETNGFVAVGSVVKVNKNNKEKILGNKRKNNDNNNVLGKDEPIAKKQRIK